MNRKILLRTLALVACLLCSLGAAAAEAYANYTPSNTTLTFYYDDYRSSRTGTTYDMNVGSQSPDWYFDNSYSSVTKVVFNSSFADARPVSTCRWFVGMTNLQSITGMQYLNTSLTLNMSSMFQQCEVLESVDLSHFNTARVTDMSYMFYSCKKLTSIDVSSFNTANVTNMWRMFGFCNVTTINLKSFNTANVTNMKEMFYACSNLTTIYVNNGWSTASVTSSTDMFKSCYKLVGCRGTAYHSSHTDATYAHIDGGTSNPGYLSDGREAYVYRTTSMVAFYYDDQRSNHTEGTTYSLGSLGWTSGYNQTIMHIIIDDSFADYRPTSTARWFYGFSWLKGISGLQYLNTSEVTDMSEMFYGCHAMGAPDLSHFNTEKVTDMSYMFEDFRCGGSNPDLSSFNTESVKNMSGMFSYSDFNGDLDLSNFNTANVTNMYGMFYSCSGLTSLDLSSFNTDSVTNMGGMFNRCDNLVTIYVGKGWSTDAVSYSSYMFYDCTSLVGGMGTAYDANHVDAAYAHFDGGPSNPGYLTDRREAYACYTSLNTTLTFYYDTQRSTRTGSTYDLNTGFYSPVWYTDGTCGSVTRVVFDPSFADARPTTAYNWFNDMTNLQTISGMVYLNTSQVTNMENMFYDCESLQSLDLSHFNTTRVTSIYGMFHGCSSLTGLDLRSFNTANVTNMNTVFYGCSSLTSLDVSSFNTASTTTMMNLFNGCSGLTTLDLGNFNTANVTSMFRMFNECSNLTTIYVADGWSTAAVTNSTGMFTDCVKLVGGRGTTYSVAHLDKSYAHIDGGTSNPGYFTDRNTVGQPEAYACYTSENTTLTFYFDTLRLSRPGTIYDLNTGTENPAWSSFAYLFITQVVFDPAFAGARPTSTYKWFYLMTKLEAITGLQYLNTTNVTNMSNMFHNCYKLTSLDVSNFNTANVTNMSEVFSGCSGVTSLDVSNFNTALVTNMSGMFTDCSGLTSLDVSNFNTANVTNMIRMFSHDSGLTSLDLRSFNTASVTNMDYMLYNCSSLTSLDVSSFNTANVTDTRFMFYGCSGLTSLDLSSFNTASVTYTGGMFNKCSNLRTIFAGDGWSTAAVTYSGNMFTDCTSIRGGMGTAYDASHVDAAYAHIDGGTANPGYFTAEGAEPWTEPEPIASICYTPSDSTLTFYYDNQHLTREGTTYELNTGTDDPTWYSDGINPSVAHVVFDPSFADARPTTTYNWFNDMSELVSITGMEYLNTDSVTNMANMFRNCRKMTSLDLGNFNTANVTDMSYMFFYCYGLTSLDVSHFNTAKVTDMNCMFAGVSKVTVLDVSGFNTSNVTNMSYMFINNSKVTSLDVSSFDTFQVTDMSNMFLGCSRLTNLDVSGFNTFQVTDMSSMFSGCSGLQSLDVSNFITDDVTSMGSMFFGCSGLTAIDVSSFNTENVTNMSGMFALCSGLTSLDVSNFDTENVTVIGGMFEGCSGLTSLDLSTFNTDNVIDMYSMFEDCSNLVTIYATGDWSTHFNTNSYESVSGYMFAGCTSLVGGKGTAYVPYITNAYYARIDGGTSKPGYFTEKVNFTRGDVNGDGLVNITDAIKLINYLATGDSTGINLAAADCNEDSTVNITDAIKLINFLASGLW